MGEPDLDPGVATDNIRMSAHLLRYLLDRSNGRVRTALASYYQGVNSVQAIGISSGANTYADAIMGRRHWFG